MQTFHTSTHNLQNHLAKNTSDQEKKENQIWVFEDVGLKIWVFVFQIASFSTSNATTSHNFIPSHYHQHPHLQNQTPPLQTPNSSQHNPDLKKQKMNQERAADLWFHQWEWVMGFGDESGWCWFIDEGWRKGKIMMMMVMNMRGN